MCQFGQRPGPVLKKAVVELEAALLLRYLEWIRAFHRPQRQYRILATLFVRPAERKERIQYSLQWKKECARAFFLLQLTKNHLGRESVRTVVRGNFAAGNWRRNNVPKRSAISQRAWMQLLLSANILLHAGQFAPA